MFTPVPVLRCQLVQGVNVRSIWLLSKDGEKRTELGAHIDSGRLLHLVSHHCEYATLSKLEQWDNMSHNYDRK